jgi:hypothetical protein
MRPQRLLAVVLVLAAALGLAAGTVAVEVGQKAPDATFTGPGNKPVKLGDLTARGPVVMYTLIQAFTAT